MDPLYISLLTNFIPYALAVLLMIGLACGLYRFLHSDDNPQRPRGLSLAVVYTHHPLDGVSNGMGNASPALQLTPR